MKRVNMKVNMKVNDRVNDRVKIIKRKIEYGGEPPSETPAT